MKTEGPQLAAMPGGVHLGFPTRTGMQLRCWSAAKAATRLANGEIELRKIVFQPVEFKKFELNIKIWTRVHQQH